MALVTASVTSSPFTKVFNILINNHMFCYYTHA